jgi:hypothetical protein
LTLIGLIMAVVILGLLASGVLMLVSLGSSEAVGDLNGNRALCAAEGGLSAARCYMVANPDWRTSAPVVFTGLVGQASFSVTMESNLTITSVGRMGDSRWTSIWTGSVGVATGQVVIAYTNGNMTCVDLAGFPGKQGDCGQSFTTPGHSVIASRVAIHFQKSRSSISSIYMTLRSGSTVGPILATSQTVASKDMPKGNNPDWVMFNLNVPVELAPNTMYFIRLSSIPASTDRRSRAKGVIHWTYRHSAFSPPAYAGGDAWLYIGRNGNPSYQGQQSGPVDQYDYVFMIYD